MEYGKPASGTVQGVGGGSPSCRASNRYVWLVAGLLLTVVFITRPPTMVVLDVLKPQKLVVLKTTISNNIAVPEPFTKWTDVMLTLWKVTPLKTHPLKTLVLNKESENIQSSNLAWSKVTFW